MVTKVIGKVDGQEVIYERSEGDLWKVTVPLDLDGMYVIEVSAYDEVGNISFCTKMLLIVDPATLCAKLISLDYTVEVVSKEYDVQQKIMILRWKQYIHITIERGAVVNRVKFILGEDKHIELLIRSPNNEPFTIISASYDLRRYGEMEASGECDINGHYLDIKLAPQCKACYVLEVTYMVADSTRKARIEVEVI